MTDVLLKQTLDDGDVEYLDGDLVTDGGIRTAAYLSLFGGNDDDGVFDDDSKTYWSNLNEVDNALKYRSETQYILKDIPLIPANLLRLEDASKRDLSWMIEDEIASNILVTASIPAVNHIRLDVIIDDLKLTFVEQVNG